MPCGAVLPEPASNLTESHPDALRRYHVPLPKITMMIILIMYPADAAGPGVVDPLGRGADR